MAAAMRKLLVFVLFCYGNISSQDTGDSRPVPKYVVDLDTAPVDRWTHIVTRYPEVRTGIASFLHSLVPDNLLPLIEDVAADLMSFIPSPYAQEMIGISKALNMSISDVLIYNLAYDVTAYCTAIISQDTEGNIWHARNLDYGFSDLMREITIHVDFQKSGKTVYSLVTFAGFVGALTGQRPNGFSVNVNERNQGGWWKNVLVALFDRSVKTVCFHVRDTLENCNTFEAALDSLAHTDVVADVYYIVGGDNPGEGAVITKSRTTVDDVWFINQTSYKWFVLETNYDHWKQPPASDDRRHPAVRYMNKMGQENISTKTLFTVLSSPPVLNNGTVHSTVMSAGQPDVMQSWVRYPYRGGGELGG